MNFLKKNFILISIIFLALFLRINFDTFVPGYNFDELAMVSIAKLSFPFEIIIKSAKLDYHAPLYYLLIHPFTYLDSEWLCLRFLNIFISILNIIVFYLIGKELKNKQLGIFLALFLTVNHLQISISNFVKFYALCFLLISLIILFLIKIFKGKNKYLELGILNFLYILSATFGIIYSLIQYLFLFFKFKKDRKNILKSASIAFFGFILYLPILFTQAKIALNNIISPHGAYQKIDIVVLYELLNDYFSPLINCACNVPTIHSISFIGDIKNTFLNGQIDYISIFSLLFLSIIPIGIIIYLFIKNKNKIVQNLAIIALSYLIIFIILSSLQVVGFVSLYVYPFGLIVFVICINSLSELKNKKMAYILFGYLIFIQLVITNCYPIEKRNEEQVKTYFGIETYLKENKKNTYIMTSGARFLKEYYKNENIFSFDFEHTGLSHDKTIAKMIYGEDFIKKVNRKNVKELITPIIKENKINQEFEKYITENLINKLKKGDTIIYVFNAELSPFLLQDSELNNFLNKKYTQKAGGIEVFSNNTIKQAEISDISTTFCNEHLIRILDKNFKRIKIEQYLRHKNGNYFKYSDITDFNKNTQWIAKNALGGWIFITYVKQ